MQLELWCTAHQLQGKMCLPAYMLLQFGYMKTIERLLIIRGCSLKKGKRTDKEHNMLMPLIANYAHSEKEISCRGQLYNYKTRRYCHPTSVLLRANLLSIVSALIH